MAGVEEKKSTEIVQSEEKMADPEIEKVEPENSKDDESSDEEQAPGLFDKPIMIFGQKRERKSVERLSVRAAQSIPRKADLDFSKGLGIKLGDLEVPKYEIYRTLANDLKPLHRLIYGKEGKVTMVKKNIRNFCGFPFSTDCKDYSNLEWNVEKFTNTGLKRLCEIFGLEVKGKRDELKEKVLTFLMKPHVTKKRAPVKDISIKTKKTEKSKVKSPVTSKKVVSDNDGGEEDEKVEEVKDNTDHEEEEEKKPKSKSKVKKTTVIKLPAPSKKKRQTEQKPAKTSTPTKEIKTQAAEESDSDDDEPLAKKSKPERPSDDMLEATVKQLLEGADLETVTMKIICKQVFDHFPSHDLTDRKSFIKDTVKKIIS